LATSGIAKITDCECCFYKRGLHGDNKNWGAGVSWDNWRGDSFAQFGKRHSPVCVAGRGVDHRLDFPAETVKIKEEVNFMNDQTLSIFRTVLKTVGAVLVTRGSMNDATLEALIGGLLAGVGLLLSYLKHRKEA